MTEETLDAAILLLRSRGLEAFGLIKDIYAREREAGDAEKIANLSLQMANLEGGMITLQQYKESIVESAKQRALDLQTEEAPEPEEDNDIKKYDSKANESFFGFGKWIRTRSCICPQDGTLTAFSDLLGRNSRTYFVLPGGKTQSVYSYPGVSMAPSFSGCLGRQKV